MAKNGHGGVSPRTEVADCHPPRNVSVCLIRSSDTTGTETIPIPRETSSEPTTMGTLSPSECNTSARRDVISSHFLVDVPLSARLVTD